MNAATTVLECRNWPNSSTKIQKNISPSSILSGYDKQIDRSAKDFLKIWPTLQKTARFESQQTATQKLSEALDDYWKAFNRLKQERTEALDSDDLPPVLTNALDHLEAQSEVTYEAVKGSMKRPGRGGRGKRRESGAGFLDRRTLFVPSGSYRLCLPRTFHQ